MVDLTDLARPLASALRTAAKPIQAEAWDHAAFQRRLHEALSDAFNGMEEPIRLVRYRAHLISATDAVALTELSEGLDACVRKLAGPEWWKRAVFWKISDGAPYAKAVNVPLREAASVARSLQPKVAGNSGLNKLDRQSYKSGSAEEGQFRTTVDRINAEAESLERLLDEAQSARTEAAAFFDGWHRGRGLVSKKSMKEVTASPH
ncbi:hypothetical protein [Microbacterium alcoholitolerans]|uniref:hypothetical protein n=1 Tax=unclassified Microbacterium TaxID=2609290 RepID=UPI000B1EFC2C